MTERFSRNSTSNVDNVLTGFDRYEKIDKDSQSKDPVYQFTPKFQKSAKNNPLCGICFPQWYKILRTRYKSIEWKVYWPRVLVISLLSLLNSLLSIPEQILFGEEIQRAEINPRPVFVLGHPRTGTTLLHSLLTLDNEQFGICSTFCAGFPSCFLWFESIGKRLFRGVIDDTRPMDNVPLDFDLPQEDELATNVLAKSLCSPYMPLFFMKQEPSFRPFYAFDDDAENHDEQLPSDQMAQSRKDWTTAFLYLLRKLTVRANKQKDSRSPNRRRRLVLKSPVHTARIALLLQLFPEAQFVYVHRHPYEIFQSAAHMADTTYWYTYLNTPTNEQIQEFILRQYEILWGCYQAGKALLEERRTSNETQLVEVSYSDLVTDPERTLRRIYSELGWTVTKDVEANWKTNLRKGSDYKPNSHRALPDSLKEVINERWGASFETLGYSKTSNAKE